MIKRVELVSGYKIEEFLMRLTKSIDSMQKDKMMVEVQYGMTRDEYSALLIGRETVQEITLNVPDCDIKNIKERFKEIDNIEFSRMGNLK